MATQPDRSEQLDRFGRRSMVALMLVGLLLGGTGLTVALSPPGGIASGPNLLWWLAPVALAALVALWTSLRRRSFSEDSPEMKTAMQDEWRRTNLLRASRGALIVVPHRAMATGADFRIPHALPNDSASDCQRDGSHDHHGRHCDVGGAVLLLRP